MRILTLSAIDPAALAMLAARHTLVHAPQPDPASLLSLISTADVVVLRSGVTLGPEAVAAAPRLRLVIRAGSGVDNIALDALAARAIPLVRLPGPGARAVAEMTFALMLALARNVLPADQQWRAGHWVKRKMIGTGLEGKVLGIYGAGNIGTTVGRMGGAWGMRVLGCVERPSARQRRRLGSHGIQLAGCDDVVSQADFLTIHVPGTPQTRGLIGHDALAAMKRGAYLVNLSRGGVVDEAALRDALVRGDLAGAALDVHANERDGAISGLADLHNVVLTPHIGASTHDAQREIGRQIVAAVEELEHEVPTDPDHLDPFEFAAAPAAVADRTSR